MVHITDWLPTIVGLCGGNTNRNKALDGYDAWAAITDTDTLSPRREILLNINPACGFGYVNPAAGVRVGDWKLLIGCFNTSTLAPNNMDEVELYNIADDPFEKSNVIKEKGNTAVVKELLARMVHYGVRCPKVLRRMLHLRSVIGIHNVAVLEGLDHM
jgi:arylsulfatase A-like enzyme